MIAFEQYNMLYTFLYISQSGKFNRYKYVMYAELETALLEDLHHVLVVFYSTLLSYAVSYETLKQTHLEMNPPLSHFRLPSEPDSKRYSG